MTIRQLAIKLLEIQHLEEQGIVPQRACDNEQIDLMKKHGYTKRQVQDEMMSICSEFEKDGKIQWPKKS